MKVFKLILSEKIGKFSVEEEYERFIKAKNRDFAYDKSLKAAASFFDNEDIGSPDEDMIFWFENNYPAIWIRSLDQINIT